MNGDVNPFFSSSICDLKRLFTHEGNEGGDLGWSFHE